jgi:hypothetical protein
MDLLLITADISEIDYYPLKQTLKLKALDSICPGGLDGVTVRKENNKKPQKKQQRSKTEHHSFYGMGSKLVVCAKLFINMARQSSLDRFTMATQTNNEEKTKMMKMNCKQMYLSVKVDRSSASVLRHLVAIVQVVADHLRSTRRKCVNQLSKLIEHKTRVLQHKEASKHKAKEVKWIQTFIFHEQSRQTVLS